MMGAPDYHMGGKIGGSAPEEIRPRRAFTPELEVTMRSALHMWFLLDRPQYDDREDMNLFNQPDAVYGARQGRDFIREITASRNPHKESRAERDAYRSRHREGTFPIKETAGKLAIQARGSI